MLLQKNRPLRKYKDLFLTMKNVETLSLSLQVSKASADLMNYCSEHARNDPLLMGIPASDNPFKDKKPCNIL